jgi:hypothetical protein
LNKQTNSIENDFLKSFQILQSEGFQIFLKGGGGIQRIPLPIFLDTPLYKVIIMWTNEWKGDNLINGSKITKHFLSTKSPLHVFPNY